MPLNTISKHRMVSTRIYAFQFASDKNAREIELCFDW